MLKRMKVCTSAYLCTFAFIYNLFSYSPWEDSYDEPFAVERKGASQCLCSWLYLMDLIWNMDYRTAVCVLCL